jgi:preprotein translocase subunit SecD
MFCEGLQPGGQAGGAGTPLGTVPNGAAVVYKPGTCESDVDASGQVAVRSADGTITRITPTFTTQPILDTVVWIPAKGDLNGAPTTMTGSFLKSNSTVEFGAIGEPLLVFNMTDDGQKVFGSLSQRLIGLPLATFLDGEPIRGKNGSIIAPTINSQIPTRARRPALR